MRVRVAIALVALAVLAVPGTASGASTTVVRIRQVDMARGGAVRLVVSVSGSPAGTVLGSQSFVVSESGRPVKGMAVEPLASSATRSVTVMLIVDTSGSTRGRPIADALSAAKGFADGLPAWIRVGLATAGSTGGVVATPSTDRAALRRSLDGLQARGETALYDAIVAASDELAKLPGQHNIVAFSDGRDTASTTTLAAAVARAVGVRAPVTAVALRTPDLDGGALASLATGTGGRVVEVAQSDGLAGAFADVAQELSSQYLVTYRASTVGNAELDVRVSLSAGGASQGDGVVVLNPRRSADMERPRPASGPSPASALAIGLVAAFVAATVALFVLVPIPARASSRVLQQALGTPARVGRGPSRVARVARAGLTRIQSTGGPSMAAASARLRRRRRGSEATLAVNLQLVGSRMSARDFSALRAGAAVAAGVVGLVLGGALLSASPAARLGAAIGLAAAGYITPRSVLDRLVARRSSAFAEQLPDTLQLLSASLEAGYNLAQGLDAVAKQAAAPTSTEFGRALSEVRLGMPLHEALTAMAERMRSEDFTWVVVALNIQREVGGNLTSILQTLADTLRERMQLRRQVKVLSAEGRVSAFALGLLPVGITAYLAIVNPSYLAVLTGSPAGRSLALVAILLMVAGTAWMRKLVRIEA